MNRKGQLGKTMTFFVVLIPILILSAVFLSGAYYLKKNNPLSPNEVVALPGFLSEIVIIEGKPYPLLDAFILYKKDLLTRDTFKNLFLDELESNSDAPCVFIIQHSADGEAGRNVDFFFNRINGDYVQVDNSWVGARRITWTLEFLAETDYISENVSNVYELNLKSGEKIFAYEGKCLHE